MEYMPTVESTREVRRFKIDGHTIILFDDIVSMGPIEYFFILTVYSDETREPVLFVASERNTLPDITDEPFLGVFMEGGHRSYETSEKYLNRESFVERAMEIVRNHLGYPHGRVN